MAATLRAISALRSGTVHPERFHDKVRAMYSWTNVAARTERVYDGITGTLSRAEFYHGIPPPSLPVLDSTLNIPTDSTSAGFGAGSGPDSASGSGSGSSSSTGSGSGHTSFALIDRLKRYYGCGIWAGKLFCVCVVVDYLIYVLLEVLAPRGGIDVAVSWPGKQRVGEEGDRDRDGREENE